MFLKRILILLTSGIVTTSGSFPIQNNRWRSRQTPVEAVLAEQVAQSECFFSHFAAKHIQVYYYDVVMHANIFKSSNSKTKLDSYFDTVKGRRFFSL